MSRTPHRPVCGAPCPFGGQESTRRRARAGLGWMGHCNRRVLNDGDRCWQHRDTPDNSTVPDAPAMQGNRSPSPPGDAR